MRRKKNKKKQKRIKQYKKDNMKVARRMQKYNAINYLRISTRVDATASRMQSALTTRRITYLMTGIVNVMNAAMKRMNL